MEPSIPLARRRDGRLTHALLPAAVLGLCVTASACGASAGSAGGAGTTGSSTSSSAPSGSPAPSGAVVVISQSTSHTVTARAGELIEVQLTSHSYRRDGTVAPWGAPSAGTTTLLETASAPAGRRCPSHATCTYFAAVHSGSGVITAVGPSGIICSQPGVHCIAVTAILRRFVVHVTAAG